ncbi:AP-5 complex subunit beta-1-like isoform X1 [Dysidea avara]|uniref:AP-5 complex subunit beta-1-like isoform X1 n=1 Tax=Dysidea avara TaxID=196820 RepID=UPI00332C478D
MRQVVILQWYRFIINYSLLTIYHQLYQCLHWNKYLQCLCSFLPSVLTGPYQLITILQCQLLQRNLFLLINAVFTSNEGQTCATKLGCLDIRFEDLFQPVPTDLVSDMDVFFKKMWAHIRNNEYSKFSPNQQGAASVIRLKVDSVRTKEVYKELSMFTTNKNSNGLNHFLKFLPPKYHLLLQLDHHSEDQSVVVSIATDYWKILPLVNNYFRT